MKYQNVLFSSFILSLHVSVYLIGLTSAQEVDDEREFNYIEGSGIGPEHWGELHEEWGTCKNGTMQSPIDLLDKRVEVVPHLGRLKRKYRPSNATLRNRGHDIMVEWADGAGTLDINGTEFVLKQSHWHSPSEHTVNGRRFDLEVHMVHQSSDEKIAVVGIIYKTGRPDKFLSELEHAIHSLADTHDGEKSLGIINPKHIKMGSRKYYRYMGSLTTPPCTEGVVWTIVNKIRTVSKQQMRLLREAVHDEAEKNARPLQQIKNRSIQFYTSKFRADVQHRSL